ncbi:hypothetical protein R7Z80_02190 [Vibrio sp. 1733]|uniref:hypothetical protein n=1 Tax=unclassified Vibrio TaxID=2614977 RepID=UPI00296412B5|nr:MULTISPECIES: hypothetical protein [unclassified Vibrio]MDW2184657.1 hypothetical protein [Vibrio sp. 1733]MDW2234985.1 hypothetical protein [Vibrio sp. 1565-1]
MELINTAIGALTLCVLIAIFFKLSAILIQMKSDKFTFLACEEARINHRTEISEQQAYFLEQMTHNIESLKDDVRDMKHVSDVFHEYKLPDRKEREFIDKIRIDNEVSEGLNKSRNNT